MLELKKITISNFRNIELQELEFSPNINCISGGNGEGKTNLLDAIWYLSMTKSSLSSSDAYNFRYGTDKFSINGHYSMPNGTSSKFTIATDKSGEKKITRDEKSYSKISQHIGVLPIVMVSPSDITLVSDSGEERRKFVNSVLSQMDAEYLSNVQSYNRLLVQRNKLLKDSIFADQLLLDTFDDRLSALARPIFEKRESFIKALSPIVQHYYALISNSKEEVSIGYESELRYKELAEILKAKRDRDISFRYTGSGVQRDDFPFTMNGYPIRRYGSQGQQKSFLVALKFAQYEVMKNTYGYPPIILLDDLFDKLDSGRVENLLKMVSDSQFGQIFLTDPDKVRTRNIVDNLTYERSYFIAEGGAFTKVDE